MEKIKVYFSGSIVNAIHINQIVSFFPKEHFEFFLPYEYTKLNVPHSKYSLSVFEKCLKLMELSNIGIINLDSFGRDSSWECGWYHAHNKPLIGYVSSNLSFMDDWMIKGGLDGILVNNKSFYNVLINDIILKNRKNNIKLFETDNLYQIILNMIKNDQHYNGNNYGVLKNE